MKNFTPALRRQSFAFTPIEILAVIAIISLIAGLLLPTLIKSKSAAKIKAAKMDMLTLIAAINQYEAEYKRMPLSSNASNSLTPKCPDFTCGTVIKGTGQPDGKITAYIVQSTNNAGYQNVNSEVMNILRNANSYPNVNSAANPRQIVFISPKMAADTNLPGVGPDGVFRDPWGNPYIITIDGDHDGKCQDGFYFPLTQSSPQGGLIVPHPVMVWSFGPDGKINPNPEVGPKGGENRDNILSWE